MFRGAVLFKASASVIGFIVGVMLVSSPSYATSSQVIQPAADEIQEVVSCRDKFATTFERSKCIEREVVAANTSMNISLRKLKTRQVTISREMSERYNPASDVESAQVLWRGWMRRECSMQANLDRGSAGAMKEASCRLRLTRLRASQLDEIYRFSG